MKKGLLLCSGGMSTTMIARKLNEIFQDEMTWDAKGVAQSSEYQDTLSNYDFVFISPQIRFLFDEINEHCMEEKIPCVQIQPQQYIVTKANELAEIVNSKIK